MSTVVLNHRHQSAAASPDAPLRVYDRFVSTAPPDSANPPSSDRATKKGRASVLGTWANQSQTASGTATGTAQPASPNEKSFEDVLKEDVASVKVHKRDESELTRAPHLSTSESAPLKEPIFAVDPLVAGAVTHQPRRDKASQVLGIPHRSSMEPIPARKRTSMMSTRSAGNTPPSPSFTPTMPLASLYVVSGLPKRPQTWTLADPDSVQGLSHTDGAVGRWWRAEVLGSTVSPGVGGGKKKKVMKGHTTQTEMSKGPGALTKQETAKMLSKALKVGCCFIHGLISDSES